MKLKLNISKFTLFRWIDLIFLTIVAILICLALYPLFESVSELLNVSLKYWPLNIQYLIISVLFGLLWFIIIRLGGFRFSDLTSLLAIKYPPTWVFGLIGAFIFIYIAIFHLNNNPLGTSTMIELRGMSIAIFIGLFIAGLFNSFFETKEKETFDCQRHITPHNYQQMILDDDSALLTWLEQEEPIKYPSQDRFNLSCIARRISCELLSELKTVGVIGPYGIGKSSLFNLIEYYLNCKKDLIMSAHCTRLVQESGKVIFCRIDGWGRYKGSIAQQILTIAINRLSNEIDCLSILTVPANYRAALSASKNMLASILSVLLHTDEEPSKTLERLDRLLIATNIQYIFLLEDFDRSISDAMILDELPALLDRLYSLKNISFVLAISTERPSYYSNILTRICDHVESLT